jgi:hypothetical protein
MAVLQPVVKKKRKTQGQKNTSCMESFVEEKKLLKAIFYIKMTQVNQLYLYKNDSLKIIKSNFLHVQNTHVSSSSFPYPKIETPLPIHSTGHLPASTPPLCSHSLPRPPSARFLFNHETSTTGRRRFTSPAPLGLPAPSLLASSTATIPLVSVFLPPPPPVYSIHPPIAMVGHLFPVLLLLFLFLLPSPAPVRTRVSSTAESAVEDSRVSEAGRRAAAVRQRTPTYLLPRLRRGVPGRGGAFLSQLNFGALPR